MYREFLGLFYVIIGKQHRSLREGYIIPRGTVWLSTYTRKWKYTVSGNLGKRCDVKYF